MSLDLINIFKNGLISQPTPGVIETFLISQINETITPENLIKAISEDVDLIQLAIQKSGVEDFPVNTLFKQFCRCNWPEIECYLTNAQKIYDIINMNPQCGALLNTRKGNDYLNRTCRRTYDYLYNFVWM